MPEYIKLYTSQSSTWGSWRPNYSRTMYGRCGLAWRRGLPGGANELKCVFNRFGSQPSSLSSAHLPSPFPPSARPCEDTEALRGSSTTDHPPQSMWGRWPGEETAGETPPVQAAGPDGISPSWRPSSSCPRSCNTYLTLASSKRKTLFLVPVPKKLIPSGPNDYRPVALTLMWRRSWKRWSYVGVNQRVLDHWLPDRQTTVGQWTNRLIEWSYWRSTGNRPVPPSVHPVHHWLPVPQGDVICRSYFCNLQSAGAVAPVFLHSVTVWNENS